MLKSGKQAHHSTLLMTACNVRMTGREPHLAQPPHVIAVVVDIHNVGLLHICGVVRTPPDGLPEVPRTTMCSYGYWGSVSFHVLYLPSSWQEGDSIHRIDLYVLQRARLSSDWDMVLFSSVAQRALIHWWSRRLILLCGASECWMLRYMTTSPHAQHAASIVARTQQHDTFCNC